jgi:hypothetical protein
MALLTGACKKQLPSLDHTSTPALTGEPRNYSATVVRTIEGGSRIEMRVARLGDMCSSEWNQEGETRVIIWRPDLGRVFHLSPDRQLYVESDLGDQQPADAANPHGLGVTAAATQGDKTAAIYSETIDRALGDESWPERVETDELPDEVVDGRSCRVVRRRASFADGHNETTLMFCARDLEGLAIRVESETEGLGVRLKIVTERRDVRTDVSQDQFVIPTGFRRVKSL